MRRLSLGRRLILLIALLSPPLLAREARWQQLVGDGFTLYSDAARRDMENFALEYTAYRQTVVEMFAPPDARPAKAVILLFRRDRDFQRHSPANQRKDVRLVAYTVEIDAGAVLALPLAGNRRQALAHVFEFDTIWTLRRFGYFVPTWMSQGAGEVLSTLRLHKGQRVVGLSDERFTSVHQAHGDLRWDRFFGIGVGSAEYDGDKATGQFHVQAWELMHWLLLHDDQGPERFRELAERLKQESPATAVAALMGVADLQREGARQLRARRPVRRLPFDEAATRARWAIGPAADVEVQVYLADLLAASGSTAEADWLVEQALAAAPLHPQVLEAAARRDLRQQQPHLAVQRYRQAAENGSLNPIAYLASANQRLNDSMSGGRDVAGGGVVPAIRAALIEIHRALDLDPGNPEAYRLLGRALFVARDLPETAMADLSRGIGAGEAGAWARFYRALLHQRLGQADAAQQDLQVLVDDADVPQALREEAGRQRIVIQLAELQQHVESLVQAADYAAAEAAWAGFDVERDEADLRQHHADLGRWLRQEKEHARQRALRPELDRVARLARDHRFREAIAAAETALGAAPDAETRADWQQLLGRVQEAQAADQVRIAFHDQRWSAALTLAQRFLERYPDSHYSSEIRAYLTQAEQQQSEQVPDSI